MGVSRDQFRVVRDDEESPVEELDRKRRQRSFGRVYRTILIVALIGAFIAGYLIHEKTKVYETYTVTSSVLRESYDGTRLMEFNGNLLYYSKDGAGATAPDGKLLWNQTFDMQNPMASTCRGYAAFADYGGSKIYLQNESGESKIISTDMPIRKIRVSSNGYTVAVLEDSDVTWIYMYDINGTVIAYFRTTMEKSGYPIDIDISPNGELVVVSYYYLDCNEEKTSVAFYNFGDVGQNNIDNYVSGYNYSDTLVPIVKFLKEDTAVALSPERISVFAGNHKPVSSSEMFVTGEVLSVYFSEDVIAVIYEGEEEDAKYRLEAYDSAGNVLTEKKFDFDYSNVTLGKETFAIYGDSSLYIGTYVGNTKFDGKYSDNINLVIPTNSSRNYVIVTEKTIDSIEFN